MEKQTFLTLEKLNNAASVTRIFQITLQNFPRKI